VLYSITSSAKQECLATHLRLQIMEPVRHVLMREEPNNADKSVTRKAVYNEIRHTAIVK